MSFSRSVQIAAVLGAVLGGALGAATRSAVRQGSPQKAEAYYRDLAETLRFTTSATILQSTIADLLRYVGYEGLSGRDLEQLASEVLMDPRGLGGGCDQPGPCAPAVESPDAFTKAFAVLPLRPDDILAARFLAPKIANVSEGAATRGHGWRKLVRLRARRGSPARLHNISDSIILFNFFTQPGERPFLPGAESVNTQVMLLSTPAGVRRGQDSLYWLDYGRLSQGGRLSLQLDAAFDAGDLQGAAGAIRPYYVPDGCVACHGENPRRAMVNYLDTDHWFDRLNDDFARVRDEGSPVIFDGGSDATSPEFARAFDVIRQFNEEASAHAAISQPRSFHDLAGRNWQRLHEKSNGHIQPVDRAVRTKFRWNPESAVDRELIDGLNRYCFRCHGTIRFNVFDKATVFSLRGVIADRLRPTPAQLKANPADQMPPDRKLPDAEIDRLIGLLRRMEAK